MMSDTVEPVTLPVLPLRNNVLFPHQLMPLAVGREASVAAVEAALATEDKTILVVIQNDAAVEEPTYDDLFRTAVVGVIKRMDRGQAGLQLIVQGIARAELLAPDQEQPFLKVNARMLPEPEDSGPEVEALQQEVLQLANQIFKLFESEVPVEIGQIVSQTQDPLHQVYLLANLFSLDMEKDKALLVAATRKEALQLMHDYLGHELQVAELRHKIATEARSEMSRQQREYFLRQQLQAIQEELGEQSPEQADVAELRKRSEEADLPEAVRNELEKELSRLERMPAAAADYQVSRTYVELVLELPWKQTTDDILDLQRARQVLDEDHFDLKDVKQRIVEQLAVMKLNPDAKAPILCFVGPPGVGKTSLGQSIARALGRKFERQSLGGMHDEAELRGHRRTYVGAMPGRILQAVRRAGVKNPLLMLDEIDKLGRDFRGDPAAALMEILDPAQNADFHDNYLDLPFDLSQVFFITTANTLDTIPRPLLDRMEVLRLAGYSDDEKAEIAVRYLIPRRFREAGIQEGQLTIPAPTLQRVIRRYTREAGVRELERTLGRIARKVATRFAEGATEPVTVEVDDLVDLLGPEKFFPEKARRKTPPGVAAGLAWTEAGGDVLYIEAVLLPGGKGLTLTGQLGDIMQESAKAAQSYVHSRADQLGIDESIISQSAVHVHVPAGAVPKDGPSAGVTMATALASVYSGCAARTDTAMTGEITLSGLVLPVGGIKEKILAAHRAGITTVILPHENQKDLRELPEHVQREMDFIPVERIEDVLAAAIPELAERFAKPPAEVAEPVMAADGDQ